MTDRVYALTVALAEDMRVDDVERVIQAISMIKGVLAIGQHISNAESWMAEERARQDMLDKLIGILRPSKQKEKA